MSRIDQTFATCRAENRPALIVYLTALDPNLEESQHIVLAALDAGADLVELGVPFSDPSADGPVIERAMMRALAAPRTGLVFDATLEVVRAVREKSKAPLVLFGYGNPLFQKTYAGAAASARAAGADGFLVVDLPFEEAQEFDTALAREKLQRIALLAPTTTPERARAICANAGGFVYYVGLLGVTGAGNLDVAKVAEHVRVLKPACAGLPLAVGFGVRDGEQAAALGKVADGIVVGSALIAAIEAQKTPLDRIEATYRFVRELRSGVDRARK